MDVLAYVEHMRPHRLNDDTRAVIRALVADHGGMAAECLEAAGVCTATARWRLRKKRLPPAIRWRRLARGLRCTSYLAAHPQASEADAARALGYADHTALIHATRRAFGVSPRAARHQPRAQLLARWWHRQEVGA
jgi:AraC-like DNA-binding protein